jgi:hypothetical protein
MIALAVFLLIVLGGLVIAAACILATWWEG